LLKLVKKHTISFHFYITIDANIVTLLGTLLFIITREFNHFS